MDVDLESIDVDTLYNLLVNYRIPPQVAERFKDQMIDGYIISKMSAIPTTLIPEIGIQVKFCEFFHEITGRTLEYPANYQCKVYEPIQGVNGTEDEMLLQHQRVLAEQQRIIQQQAQQNRLLQQQQEQIRQQLLLLEQQRLQQGNLTQSQLQTPITPITAQQVRTIDVEDVNKIPIPYPAPLPEFSDMVEHYLKSNDCLKIVYLMNRELVDYYNQNNYELTNTSNLRNVCQTLLEKYPELNAAVSHVVELENHLRNRRNRLPLWSFLSKKLSYRRRYVKKMKEREAIRAGILANRNLTAFANVVQNQQYLVQNVNSTPATREGATGLDSTIRTQQQFLTPIIPSINTAFNLTNQIRVISNENAENIVENEIQNVVVQQNSNEDTDINNNNVHVDENNNLEYVQNRNIEQSLNNVDVNNNVERTEELLRTPPTLVNNRDHLLNLQTTQDLFHELEQLEREQLEDDNIADIEEIEEYNEEYISDVDEEQNEEIQKDEINEAINNDKLQNINKHDVSPSDDNDNNNNNSITNDDDLISGPKDILEKQKSDCQPVLDSNLNDEIDTNNNINGGKVIDDNNNLLQMTLISDSTNRIE